jgi:hypothetical protein
MGNDPWNQQISQLSKTGRQHLEIQPSVAKINLYHTEFDLSNRNQSQNLEQPKSDAENECSNHPTVTKDQAVT